ncbi:hypothetical protein LZ31DRAFT_601459 [Colletotrichum somersetense]|nr:hypothetical protein LZ31DRAFT_601459 [Colletotrichum somersetense]
MTRLIHFAVALYAILVQLVLGQKDVTELFKDVNTQDNDDGGCAYVGLANLNKIVKDAHDMANGARNLIIASSRGDKMAQRLVKAFFNTENSDKALSSAQLSTLRGRYKRVRDWLRSGGPVDDGVVQEKPHLFCDSNFLVRKIMDDYAVQADGTFVKDGKGNNMKIKQIKEYRKEQERIAKLLSTPTRPVSVADVVPYWNKLSKSYEFDRVTPGKVDSGPCHEKSKLNGFAYAKGPFPFIVLCPRAFGLSQSTKENHWTYRPVQLTSENRPSGQEIGTVASVDNGDVDNLRSLSSISPTAKTFLHEMFHLVLGDARSYPKGGEVSKTSEILSKSYDVSSLNPETYSLMAVALANTLEQDLDNMVLNWDTGWATSD